jgi:hypothetical protein
MKIKRTKLYRDMIDVRSYEAIRCIELRENLEITYEGKKMTLTPEQLKTECVEKGLKQHSIKGSAPYSLWSYIWIPDE